MRYLIDIGCKFVGHGLKKDFRIINVHIPNDQVFDTVELFHKPRQRKIALRFLASFLLNEEIQSQTHDSIEDANTAMKVYKKYSELVEKGTFKATLDKIYLDGQRRDWKTRHERERETLAAQSKEDNN